MGIFDRLSTLIRSNINDLINRAENPEKMLNQLIVDMRSQLAKAKQQVAAAIADEKRLSAQVDTEKKSAEDWERRAVLAVQEGRDDLAKQALLRHNEHAQGAVQLHETWVKHREETEKLKLSLRQLNDRIEEAKRKKNILIARQKRAEAHKRIQETMSSIGDKSVFETFERMTEQIEHEERKLIAAAEVNEDLSGDTLVKQFQSLEVRADADQQLIELKRKMGLLPAASAGESKQLGKGAAEAELVEDDDAPPPPEHHRCTRSRPLRRGCRAPRSWRSSLPPWPSGSSSGWSRCCSSSSSPCCAPCTSRPLPTCSNGAFAWCAGWGSPPQWWRRWRRWWASAPCSSRPSSTRHRPCCRDCPRRSRISRTCSRAGRGSTPSCGAPCSRTPPPGSWCA